MSHPTIVYVWLNHSDRRSLSLCWRSSTGWVVQSKGLLSRSVDWTRMATILAGQAITVSVLSGQSFSPGPDTTKTVDVPGPVFLDMLRDRETGIPGITWEEKV